MIDASAAGVTGLVTASPSAAADMGKLNTDYQAFLKLLVAQIENQDPLEPMDSTTFVSQLAQLSQVEQAIMTNANLEMLVGKTDAARTFSDVALLGREVRVVSDRVSLEDGRAAFSLTPSSKAESVEISILDEAGAVVRRIQQGRSASGDPMNFVWDGADETGAIRPDGIFTVKVDALDAEGKRVGNLVATSARVEALDYQGGGQVLRLSNGAEIGSSAILGVM
jgi:flagellar basal-body rod modification protein FlgD